MSESNIIRYHDHEKAAKCWARDAKWANEAQAKLRAPDLIPNLPPDTAPSEMPYWAPVDDPA